MKIYINCKYKKNHNILCKKIFKHNTACGKAYRVFAKKVAKKVLTECDIYTILKNVPKKTSNNNT